MPVPIAVAVRQQIVERHQGGTSLRAIAHDLDMAYESVRNVWRLYQKEGRITPNYGRCGRQGPRGSQRVYRAAVVLKRLHPRWGAPLIRHLIGEKWPEEALPSERSLQRWFRQAGLNTARTKPVGEARRGRAKATHHVWELDSREDIALASGQKVTWLVVSDEASGAVLQGAVFPHGQGQPTECGRRE